MSLSSSRSVAEGGIRQDCRSGRLSQGMWCTFASVSIEKVIIKLVVKRRKRGKKPEIDQDRIGNGVFASKKLDKHLRFYSPSFLREGAARADEFEGA